MKASSVLLILVCLVISAVFGVLYVYRYVYDRDVLPDTVPTSRSVASASEAVDTPAPQPAATPTYSILPRVAYTYDGVTVGVTGTQGDEHLLDYYAFGGYVYCMLATATDSEDYRAAAPSLAVARFDDQCTLADTLTLPQSAGYTYLAAAMFDYGIMIAAASSSDVRLWTVSPNLTCRTVCYAYRATAARMLYDASGVVLALAGDNLHLLFLSPDMQLIRYHSAPLAGKILLGLYAYANAHWVLATDSTEGAAYCFDDTGYVRRAVLPSIDAYTPYADGFAVASRSEGKLVLLNYTFTRVGQVDLPIGGQTMLSSYDKGILLLATGTDTTGYLLCNHGDVQYTFTFDASPTGPLFYDKGRFYFTSTAAYCTTVYSYVPYADAPTAVASHLGAVSPLVWASGRHLYCLCDSDYTYGLFSGSLGGVDVYLLRSSYQ